MADYPLPNPQLPFGQQAVSPVAQTNPLQSLAQGGVQGFSLGLAARQQAMLQDQQQRQAAEQQQRIDLERQKQEDDKAERGLDHLTDTKFSKFLSNKAKVGIFKESVVPYLNKTYGFNIDPNTIPDTEPISEEEQNFLHLVKNKADKSVISAAYAEMVSKGQPEQLPLMKEMGAAAGVGSDNKVSSFMRPISRVSESGNPLYFSAAEGYMEADPETGGYKPYTGKQMPMASNPSTGAETALRSVTQQKGILNEALTNLTPDKVGVINKKWKDVGTYMDQSTDPEAVYFRSLTELANTMIRYQYYGATLTNNEQKAFSQIAANRDLSVPAFMAQVKAMNYAMKKVEDSIYSSSAAANRPFSSHPETSTGTPPPNDSEYEKDKQDAAVAISKGLVTAQEASERLRQKYPGKGH